MKIKVCGMRETDNIRAVERLDVDWMGFIFYPSSSRYVPDDETYSESVRRCAKKKTGVFVNVGVEEMLEKASRYGLDYLQLHGHESPETCAMIQQQGYPVIKAFAVASAADLEQTAAYETCASYFLFDTKCDAYGGSGKRFDWSALDSYRGRTPFLLSGGISPDCIDALRGFNHPEMAGIDLNSGFETAPAFKDAALLERFIHQLRTEIYK
jgi:phosphoribosylanthranilate isomerase